MWIITRAAISHKQPELKLTLLKVLMKWSGRISPYDTQVFSPPFHGTPGLIEILAPNRPPKTLKAKVPDSGSLL